MCHCASELHKQNILAASVMTLHTKIHAYIVSEILYEMAQEYVCGNSEKYFP